MRKIYLAFFMAILMLLLPITSVAQSKNIDKIRDITPIEDEEVPEVYIEESELLVLNNYIENNFEEQEKIQAYNILNRIIGIDLRVDFVALANAIDEYGYEPIPDSSLENVTTKAELNDLINTYWDFATYLFEGLINKIIELIKNRLGWLYDLYDEGRALFVDGVDIIVDFIANIQNIDIAIILVSIVNVIITMPATYVKEALGKLFNLNFKGFLEMVTNFTNAFTDDFVQLIDDVAQFLDQLGEIFDPVVAYLNRVGDFADWLINDKPWEDRIEVTGKVTALFGGPLSDAKIECKGQTSFTDDNGEFSFYVYPDQISDDSFPKNSYYGMHNCQISVQYNGEIIKQTPNILSYVFSSGKISWNFFSIKGKSIDTNTFFIFELLENLFEKIGVFLPKLVQEYAY